MVHFFRAFVLLCSFLYGALVVSLYFIRKLSIWYSSSGKKREQSNPVNEQVIPTDRAHGRSLFYVHDAPTSPYSCVCLSTPIPYRPKKCGVAPACWKTTEFFVSKITNNVVKIKCYCFITLKLTLFHWKDVISLTNEYLFPKIWYRVGLTKSLVPNSSINNSATGYRNSKECRSFYRKLK